MEYTTVVLVDDFLGAVNPVNKVVANLLLLPVATMDDITARF